ncbi:MAG: tetratricopeptide repeat protein, partial [Candidatus Sumerlaeia bacterium]|nr:tetratricopeptide repeat protein [Candidatus Sumerlaeia bacterium]
MNIQVTPLWEKETGLCVPNELVLDDLNYDHIPELIVTDIKGHLVVFNAVTGEKIWSRSFKNVKLTAASVGNFLEDYRRNLAVGSGDGFVYICDGMTGKVLLKIDVGADVIFPPTPVHLGLSESTSIQEGLVVIDSKGKVHLYEITGTNNLNYNERWSLWTGARITSPASIGFISGKNHPDVIVGTTAGDIWVINVMHRQDKTPLKFTNLSRRPPIKIIVPMELTGDNQQELVFYDEGNNLNAIKYEAGSLALVWSEVPVYGSPAARPISIDLNQDGKREIIISSSQALNCILGSIGERCWQKTYNVLANIISGPALFMTRDKIPLLFLTDDRALGHFVDVHSGSEYAVIKFKNNQLLYSSLLADIQGDGFLDILGMDSRGLHIFAYQTNIPVEPKRFFWLSTGGNAYLTSSIDGFYWERRNRLFQRAIVFMSEEISIAKASAEKHNWNQSALHARNVLRLNPFDVTARRIYRQAWIRAHIVIIVLILIALFALATATGIALIRFFHRQALLHKANQLISQQKSAEAIRILQTLIKKDHTNKQIASLLARELIKLGDFSPENISVFELAYSAHKDDLSFLKALAIAYNNAQIQNDTALAIYLSAYPNLENRAPFAFRIAQIYKEKGDLQKSAKFFREAIRCGLDSDEVYKRLTEVYLAMNCSEPKVIKIFERVYPEYKDNPDFLKLLATAYQQTKRTDPQARQVYEKVLQIQPNFLPALIQMAQIKIEENNLADAEKFAEATLNIDSDNGAGLLLLSQCYLLRDRQDNKAIKVYEQTLRHYPENKDILRVLAINYWQRQRLDEEARAIYTRAYHYHQNNPEILFAMSKVEEHIAHPELVTEIGERLVQMRLALPEHYLWLARAYQRLHIIEPKAIEIYQRALTIEPDNVSFLFLLGESLICQDRKDTDSIAVYEKILLVDNKQIKFAKQLARAYIQNRIYEKCISLTTEMLKLFPGEKDLLHLLAQASLLNNQIDEAIREYKRILQENPDDEVANVNLALAYAQKL